jgi:ribosome-associated translation inhibitor RaiA
MQIQVNTDDNVEGGQALAGWVEGVVQDNLSSFPDWLTGVEVHIGDENSAKGGAADKRCMMEARVRGRPPIAVTEHASTVDQAVQGAAQKLSRALRHVVDKLQDPRR